MRLRRAAATGVVVAVSLLAAGLLPVVAEAAGWEDGTFPDRQFYVTRSGGSSPRADTYVTQVIAYSTGEWYLRLEGRGSSWIVVEIRRLDGGVETLEGFWKLRDIGDATGRVLLFQGAEYRLALTPFGRPGTSVLSEHFLGTRPPTGCFTHSPSDPVAFETIVFDATCSSDSDGQVVEFRWDFGDGATGTAPVVSHSYGRTGTFEVLLEVIDDRGASARASRTLVILLAVFVGPHTDRGTDSDGDGLFNFLDVDARIRVALDGSYLVRAVLQPVGLTSEYFPFLVHGENAVLFRFDGISLRESGTPGPYAVELSALNYAGGFLDADLHVTGAYDPLAFDSSPARLSPPHPLAGQDTDADGLVNHIDLSIQVEVFEPGRFEVDGRLFGPGGEGPLAGSANGQFLGLGSQVLPIRFDGVPIGRSGVDGPYSILLALRDSTALDPVDTGTVITAPLVHTDFDSPSGVLVSVTDHGRDDDGDGLFDWLEIDVAIDVMEAREFQVHGVLTVGASVFVESVFNFLDVGPSEVAISFGGPSLRSTGASGPYALDVSLWDLTAANFADEVAHSTAPYSFLDFDEFPAQFTGVFEESGESDDADSAFEYLVVRAEVSATIGGTYLVGMDLSWQGSTIQFCFGPLTFEVGRRIVTCRFEGPVIYASGLDGPYAVELLLWDAATGLLIDQEFFVTRAYSHTDFESATP